LRTAIQNRYVILSLLRSVLAHFPGLITAEIAIRFEENVPVVLRTAEAIDSVLCRNLIHKAEVEQKELDVLFRGSASAAPRPGAGC
jgi:hypothetical protein